MKYEFIIYKQFYYVPRLPSLCEARERNEVFIEHFNVEPLIVGDVEWNIMTDKLTVTTLHVGNV